MIGSACCAVLGPARPNAAPLTDGVRAPEPLLAGRSQRGLFERLPTQGTTAVPALDIGRALTPWILRNREDAIPPEQTP
jgi:hypothetical protein